MSAGATRTVATGNPDYDGTNAHVSVSWSTEFAGEVGLEVVDFTATPLAKAVAFLTVEEAEQLAANLTDAVERLRAWRAA